MDDGVEKENRQRVRCDRIEGRLDESNWPRNGLRQEFLEREEKEEGREGGRERARVRERRRVRVREKERSQSQPGGQESKKRLLLPEQRLGPSL